jgi:tetratricopeptide (TPR) repeat protein
VWDKALLYLRQAGAKAFVRSANREAVAWFEQALAALKRLPESNETRGQAIDIRFDLRSSLLPLGEFSRILDYLHEAQDLAGKLADRSRLGRVCAYLTDYFRQIGAHERAIESGQVALSVAKENGDLGLEVATNIYLGHVYFDMGQYKRGVDFLAKNVDCWRANLAGSGSACLISPLFIRELGSRCVWPSLASFARPLVWPRRP